MYDDYPPVMTRAIRKEGGFPQKHVAHSLRRMGAQPCCGTTSELPPVNTWN
jgi:hypothetical protein